MDFTKYTNTRLYYIENLFKESFPAFGFDFRRGQLNSINAYLKGKKAKDATVTGLIFCPQITDPKTGARVNGSFSPLSIEQIEIFFTQADGFNRTFRSPHALLNEIVLAIRENAADREKAIFSAQNRASEAGEMLAPRGADDAAAEAVKPIFVPVALNTSPTAVLGNVSPADEMFTKLHLMKDSQNQLYWRFNNNIVRPIPVCEDKGRLLVGNDPRFWEQFFDDNGVLLKNWINEIKSITDKYQTNCLEIVEDSASSSVNSNDIPLFEKALYERIPTCILASIQLGLKYTKDLSTKKMLCRGVDIRLKGGVNGNPSKTRNDWQEVLRQTLLQSIPVSSLNTIKVFSNTSTISAIHTLPPIPVRAEIPTHRPELVEYDCFEWMVFFRGTGPEGNTKFPSQCMGEFRFAKMLYSIISSTDFSRQILCVFGEGADGKSVCFDAITKALNDFDAPARELALAGLSQKAFTDNFGLMPCINKRLLVVDDIPEPYDFIESEKVKRISGAGAGELQIDIKFAAPYKWQPEGCKIIMSTNNSLVLRNEAGLTRCLPLTFTRNYNRKNRKDPADLVEALAAEIIPAEDGKGLLVWAIDTLLFYSHLRNINGELFPGLRGINEKKSNGRYCFDGCECEVYTDEMLSQWYKGELELSPEPEAEFRSIRTRAYEDETTIPHKALSFIRVSQDSATDESESGIVQEVSAKLLFVEDSLSFVKTSEVAERILYILQKPEMRDTDIYTYLGMCGLKDATSAATLTRSVAYRNLLQTVFDLFKIGAATPRRINNKVVKVFEGIALRDLAELKTLVREGVI